MKSPTNLSVSSDCGCKQQEDTLSAILKATQQNSCDLSLVVGFESNDDCAVYDMNTDEDIKSIIKGGTETLDQSKCLIVGGIAKSPSIFDSITVQFLQYIPLGRDILDQKIDHNSEHQKLFGKFLTQSVKHDLDH